MTSHDVAVSRRDGPSAKECIAALHEHNDLFEQTAECPQMCIYNRFDKESALAIAYLDSKVHRCGRVAESFIRETLRPGFQDDDENEGKLRGQHEAKMDALVQALLLRGMLLVPVTRVYPLLTIEGRMVKNFQKVNLAPPPSKVVMSRYRIVSRIGKGSKRIANGELASTYGYDGEPIPPNLATVDNEDLEPMAQFVYDWLANPINEYIIAPVRKLWYRLPVNRRRRPAADVDAYGMDAANARFVSAVANVFVYVIAILILIAPIATFNSIQEQTLRIVVMPLFCLVLAASAQLMGSRSMPLFTLVTA
jgi:hypothetical protein